MDRRHGLRALAAAALAGPAAARAAWQDVLDTPAIASDRAARGLFAGLATDGRRTLAVGQRGHVLVSDDAGGSWSQATVPLASDLTAVCSAPGGAAWAVGHDAAALVSRDGGRSWTRRFDGRTLGPMLVQHYEREGDAQWTAQARRWAEQGPEASLLDVWFGEGGEGWAVGAFGLLLHTGDGGDTWVPMMHRAENPKSLHLYAVRGIGTDRWIVGEQGLAMRLDRASGRFRAVAVPYAGSLFGLVGNGRVLLVHGLRGTLLRSLDDGRSWRATASGVAVGLPAATVLADGRLVVGSQAGHLRISGDDGATFTPLELPRPLPVAALCATAAGRLVIAGPRGLAAVPLA